jgi:hypothetical protein
VESVESAVAMLDGLAGAPRSAVATSAKAVATKDRPMACLAGAVASDAEAMPPDAGASTSNAGASEESAKAPACERRVAAPSAAVETRRRRRIVAASAIMTAVRALSVIVAASFVCVAAALASLAACGGVTAVNASSDASADGTAVYDAATGSFDVSTGSLDAPPSFPDTSVGCGFSCDAGGGPRVVCPATPPTPGTACDVSPTDTCEYGSSWWLVCNLVMTCTAGQWTVQPQYPACAEPDAGPACPATWAEAQAIVADAAPSNCQFVSCVYPEGWCGCGIGCGGGGGAPAPRGELSGYFWCIPSSPGCPEPRPLGGTACEPDGGYCNYGFACGCGQEMRCDQGVWTAFPGPPCP